MIEFHVYLDETSLPTNIAEELSNVSDCLDSIMGDVVPPTAHIVFNTVSEDKIRPEQDQAARIAQTTLETENNDLKQRVSALQRQIDEQLRESTTHVTERQSMLDSTFLVMENLQQQLSERTKREQVINDKAKQISIVEYTIPKANQAVIWKFNLIMKVLKRINYDEKEYFKDSVPTIDLLNHQDCTIELKGFPEHHTTLKAIFNRLQNLFDRAQKVTRDYEQQVNRKIQLLVTVIERIRPTQPMHWKHYRGFLIHIIRDQQQGYISRFKDYIDDRLKTLTNGCIEGTSAQNERDIRTLMTDYMQGETFVQDLELWKVKALDEFIHDQVLLQQKSTKSVPAKESIATLNQLIAKTKSLLTTDANYHGCELKHFRMIVPLLQRIIIYYNCFLSQLPLFNASIELLNRIETNTITTIATATGSGEENLTESIFFFRTTRRSFS